MSTHTCIRDSRELGHRHCACGVRIQLHSCNYNDCRKRNWYTWTGHSLRLHDAMACETSSR